MQHAVTTACIDLQATEMAGTTASQVYDADLAFPP